MVLKVLETAYILAVTGEDERSHRLVEAEGVADLPLPYLLQIAVPLVWVLHNDSDSSLAGKLQLLPQVLTLTEGLVPCRPSNDVSCHLPQSPFLWYFCACLKMNWLRGLTVPGSQ